jgi:hypothetical protein
MAIAISEMEFPLAYPPVVSISTIAYIVCPTEVKGTWKKISDNKKVIKNFRGGKL